MTKWPFGGAQMLVWWMGALEGYAQSYSECRILTGGAAMKLEAAARAVAQAITGPLGRHVIIDRRTPYLVGDVAAAAVADGYTVLRYRSILRTAPM